MLKFNKAASVQTGVSARCDSNYSPVGVQQLDAATLQRLITSYITKRQPVL